MGSRIESFDAMVRTLWGLRWNWKPEGAASALELAGFLSSRRSSDPLAFRSIDGFTARIAMRGGQVGSVAIVLDELADAPHRLDTAELASSRERLLREFYELARRMERVVGKPAFLGRAGEAGFPDDRNAARVVVWPSDSFRLMLEIGQDDPSLPVQLRLAVAPPGKGGALDDVRRSVPTYEEYETGGRPGTVLPGIDAVRQLHERALVLAEAGRYDESLADFRAVLEADPGLGAAWHDLGHLLAMLGRREEALACLDKTVALEPGNPLVWRNRGKVFTEMGMFDEAIECFERAVAIDPADAVAWFQKGFAERNAGRHEAVRRSLRRFVDLDPPGMREDVAKIAAWLESTPGGQDGSGGSRQ